MDPVTAQNYGPTLSAEINALPDRLRQYVHDLETRADPTWDLRRAFAAEENAMALQQRVLELELAIAKLRVHFPEMLSHPDEKIRQAADAIANALSEAGQ